MNETQRKKKKGFPSLPRERGLVLLLACEEAAGKRACALSGVHTAPHRTLTGVRTLHRP